MTIKLDEKLDKSALIDAEPSAPTYPGVNVNPLDLFYVLEQFALIKCNETGKIHVGLDADLTRVVSSDDYIDEQDDSGGGSLSAHRPNQSLEVEQAADKRKESIFDLIFEMRDELRKADIESEEVQRRSGLKPSLRPYQIEAVRWMLNREATNVVTESSKTQAEPHPFYIKVTNAFNQTIYLHKFFCIYSTTMPRKELSMPGGILADEMGLGKQYQSKTLNFKLGSFYQKRI